MTAPRKFVASLVALVVVTCCLIGLFLVSLRFFTYQGSGMDWIYPTLGLLMVFWFGSAGIALSNGISAVSEYRRRKRSQV